MSVPMSQQLQPTHNYTNGGVRHSFEHYSQSHFFLQNQLHHLNQSKPTEQEKPSEHLPQAASTNEGTQHKINLTNQQEAEKRSTTHRHQPMVDEQQVESTNENPNELREHSQHKESPEGPELEPELEPEPEPESEPELEPKSSDSERRLSQEHYQSSEHKLDAPVDSEQRNHLSPSTQETRTQPISKVPSESRSIESGFRFEGPAPSFDDLKDTYTNENTSLHFSSPVSREHSFAVPPHSVVNFSRNYSPPSPTTPTHAYHRSSHHAPPLPIHAQANLRLEHHKVPDFRPDYHRSESQSSDGRSDSSLPTSNPTTPTSNPPYLSPGTPVRIPPPFPTSTTPTGRIDQALLGTTETQGTNDNSKDIFFCHLCSYVGKLTDHIVW